MTKTNICKIEHGKIWLDGEIVFSTKGESFDGFAKEAYHFLNISYPKFFKMDRLSKLAFLAAEIVLNNSENPDTALVFGNRSSSLDTDIEFFKSIESPENYFPSPAVFVYTLPNICLGEISIRHRLNSENAFFILEDEGSEDFLSAYAAQIINAKKSTSVLCGWTELLAETYSAFVYLLK